MSQILDHTRSSSPSLREPARLEEINIFLDLRMNIANAGRGGRTQSQKVNSVPVKLDQHS